MRKIAYGSVILVAALLATIVIDRLPQMARPSPTHAADTINVQKLGEAVDMKALPQQRMQDEVYH